MDKEITYYGTVTMDSKDYIAMVDLMRSYKSDAEFWRQAYNKKAEELKKLQEDNF